MFNKRLGAERVSAIICFYWGNWTNRGFEGAHSRKFCKNNKSLTADAVFFRMIGDSFISKNNNVDVSVGQSVQSRRLELGLSLEDVAKACGINSERLSSYERGETYCFCCPKFLKSRLVISLPICNGLQDALASQFDYTCSRRYRVNGRCGCFFPYDAPKRAPV